MECQLRIIEWTERKLDLMIKELKRFGVSIAGIQETNWFGSDIWSSGGGTFLHSRQAVPLSDAHYLRNKGVGIFLDEKASEAWKLGEEVWKTVSSRTVTARLKVSTSGFQLWNRRPMSTSILSIISVYAPTFRSSVAVKKAFTSSYKIL